MKGFHTYFTVQLKRVIKLLPALMTVTLAACGCLGVFATLYLNSNEATADSRKYRVAVVGDTNDSYLGFGISALSVMDDSRFMVEFPVMTEDEARRELMLGEVTAYAKVPEGLVDSIVYGTNDRPVTFVGATGQKGITGILVEELTKVASTLIVRSQSAIYGMQSLLLNNGMGDLWQEATETLNIRLIDMVLSRTGLCDLEILGIANGLSTEGYYLCSMLVFFLLLSGINASPLFGRRNREISRLAASRGLGAAGQIAGEYLAYYLLELCCLLGVFAGLSLALWSGALQITEWKNAGVGELAAFFVRLLPVTAALAAMQLCVYELVTGVVNSILLQFVCGISMAYLSGCFYPASMFPDTLRRIGEMLPVGLALQYADSGLSGETSMAGAGLVLYLAMFLGLTILVRRYRIQRG